MMRIAGLGIALVLVGCGKVQPLQMDAAPGSDAPALDAPGPGSDAADALVPEHGFINGSFEDAYAGWQLAEDSGMPMAGYWGIAANNTMFAQGTSVHDYNDDLDGVPMCFNGAGVGGTPAITVVASDGASAAFNAQSGAVGHLLWQDLTIPAGAQLLTWSMSWTSVDPLALGSQSIAIELRDPATDAIKETLYATDPAASPAPPLAQAMSAFAAPIDAYAGQTVRVTVDLQARADCLFAVFDDFRITP
jgi:hypothetical protein